MERRIPLGSVLSHVFETTHPAPSVHAQDAAPDTWRIQGLGAVAVVHRRTRLVTGCSADVGAYFDTEAHALLDQADSLLPHAISRELDRGPVKGAPFYSLLSEETAFDLVSHWQDDHLIVDILAKPDRASLSTGMTVQSLSSAFASILKAPSSQSAIQSTTDAVSQLSGFGHVMLCEYTSDGSGKVIAETRASTRLAPCLGKYFPSSGTGFGADQQLTHRAIPCTENGASQAFLPSAIGHTTPTLERSLLRPVAPSHATHLRALGVQATFTTTLALRGRPWGAIVCHHPAPLSLGYAEWGVVADIGNALMARLDRETEQEACRRLREACAIKSKLASERNRLGRMEEAIQSIVPALRDFAQADGLAFVYRGKTITSGKTPPQAFMDKIPIWALAQTAGHSEFETTSLQALLPEALTHIETSCGILIRRITTQRANRLIWFRGPQSGPRDWIGDPSLTAGLVQSGQQESLPWDVVATDANRAGFNALLDAVAGQLVLMEDNSDLKTITGQLIQHQQHEALHDFFTSAVHDLKAPLRAIKFALDMMKEEDFDPQAVTDAYQIAETSGERMVTLTDSILTLANVQSSPPKVAPIDMLSLLDDVRAVLSADFSTTQARMELRTLPMIVGDRDQIARLFENIISNAIKYRSSDRAPHIVIEGRLRGGRVTFSVADNGVGISRDTADEVFKPMVRLHSKDHIEGVGLGLTICKGIVEVHDGDIRCEPRDPFGLRIVFDLPAHIP